MLKIATPDQLYVGLRATNAFGWTLATTYEVVYHSVIVGLDPFRLVIVGVVLQGTMLLFEIPTGVVADVYSRRWSVITGVFLTGLGFLLEGLIPSLLAIIIAQVIWGIGFTFYSGAEAAWITDEIGDEQASQAMLRAAQASQITSLLGIGAGALLINFSVQTPIIIGALLFLLNGSWLLFTMPETRFQPILRPIGQSMLEGMIQPFLTGIRLIRLRPMLLMILFISLVSGLYASGFDRLYVPHLVEEITLPQLDNWAVETWFGILSGSAALCSLIGVEVVRRRLDLTNESTVIWLLAIGYSGIALGTLVFAWTDRFLVAVIVYCLFQGLRSMMRPIFIIWMNLNTTSSVRATIQSMGWQMNALGGIGGSPLLGWLGITFSLRVALSLAAAAYSLVLPLLLRTQQAASKRR